MADENLRPRPIQNAFDQILVAAGKRFGPIVIGAVGAGLSASWIVSHDNSIAIERLEREFERRGGEVGAVSGKISLISERLHEFLIDYARHKAWGEEWVQGALRRFEQCEQRMYKMEEDK